MRTFTTNATKNSLKDLRGLVFLDDPDYLDDLSKRICFLQISVRRDFILLDVLSQLKQVILHDKTKLKLPLR